LCPTAEKIAIRPYKLIVYQPGDFFSVHVDTMKNLRPKKQSHKMARQKMMVRGMKSRVRPQAMTTRDPTLRNPLKEANCASTSDAASIPRLR
jgi:hypothetical protein